MKQIDFRKKANPSLNKRFNLIELMLVIAVIAILSSFLLPVLNKAKKAARIAVCASNQKQIGIAFYSSAHDNDNYLPKPGAWSWDDLLSDYDGRNLTSAQKGDHTMNSSTYGQDHGELYRCPLFDGSPTVSTLDISYAVSNYSGGAASGLGVISDTGTNANTAKITRISKPDETIMLFDYNRPGYSKLGRNDHSIERATDFFKWEVLSGTTGEMMHGNYDVNYLMIDGSVKEMDVLDTLHYYKPGAAFNNVRGTMWDATR
ncbi:type II secretion system protein [Lentisphaera profundi]|uniref:Type II secretion system protein n=1 Tax=Lentisphaera profundi TaxID=1658616 RepID=A0ABY7VZ26_9BACT|nr:type II secretion system protein [Lentisphaera profundi]WDE98962.1 type II secretion system protein [Lentisphaera profundi]